jgi:hypothetical protein
MAVFFLPHTSEDHCNQITGKYQGLTHRFEHAQHVPNADGVSVVYTNQVRPWKHANWPKHWIVISRDQVQSDYGYSVPIRHVLHLDHPT